MRDLASALLLRLLALLAPMAAAAADRVVNVYNWTDYIDPGAIERFQREIGIAVRYDVYDSVETLEGKLLAGRSGYDVVVPTSEPTFSRLIRAGALQPPGCAAREGSMIGRWLGAWLVLGYAFSICRSV